MSPESVDSPGDGDLPEPVIEDLLATSRRQHLLVALLDASEPMALDDLAGEIRARQRDTSADVIQSAERRGLRRDLLETDLPKLTATGVVGYDSMLATVELEEPSVGRAAARRTSDDDSARDGA